jgi:protein SCO1/2
MRWAWLLLFVLAACGRAPAPAPEFHGTDITGAEFGKQIAMNDFNGRPVTLESFRGKWVVLLFGYTHCPDVCPTTLSDLASALKLMPADEVKQVQVLFVTVDPERDTADMLKNYVPYFDPSFLGLIGTPEQVAQAAKEFRVVYRKHQEAGTSEYLVDHSAGSYVLDGHGRMRLFLPFGESPQDVSQDLMTLMKGVKG